MADAAAHRQVGAEEAQISKSQLKKQLKRRKWLEARPERRRIEKQKRKERRKIEAQNRNGANQTIERPRSQRPKLMAESKNKFRIVIDMDFNEFMTDSEMGKAAQQVARIYALNRHCQEPCQLYISSLKGKICDKFDATNTGYKKWDVHITELDFTEIFKTDTQKDSTEAPCKFVYLSGDAEDNLPTTEEMLRDEYTIYIIGGLVDHNRHKNLCHQKALERNIPTAKLPIKEHVKLCQRTILSTVTVFDVLLRIFAHRNSWLEALTGAIPKRKIASVGSAMSDKVEKDRFFKAEENEIVDVKPSDIGDCGG